MSRAERAQLFGGLLLLYGALSSGRLMASDEIEMVKSAVTMSGLVPGEGELSRYAPGMPLLEVPFIWLARVVTLVLGPEVEVTAARFTLFLLPPLLGALCGLLTCLLALRMGQSRRAALVSALLASLGSPLLVYATRLLSELPQAVVVLLAVWAVHDEKQSPEAQAPRLGAAMSAMCIIKPFTMILVGAPLGLLLLLRAWRGNIDQRVGACLRVTAGAVLAAVPGVAIYAAFNMARYGTVVDQGYANEGFSYDVITGLYGQLLSSGTGLLVFMPLALPALASLALATSSSTTTQRWALLGVPAAVMLGYGLWWSWHGGWAWGARFVVPVLPLLALAAGGMDWNAGPHWRRHALVVLGVLSVLVQLPGVAVSFQDYAAHVFQACQSTFPNRFTLADPERMFYDDQTNVHFIPMFSPPLGHAWMALERAFSLGLPAPWEHLKLCQPVVVPPAPLEFWWSRMAATQPQLAGFAYTSALALLAGGATLLWRTWRGTTPSVDA
ncbi:MAG: hypothetical protein AB2A00_03155 [Myxococcota bacterium]